MFVIGVDGGTTKTIAMVANEQGQILGYARGLGSNWTGENVETPMTVVVDTVQQALDQAQLNRDTIDLGVFSLSGADWPEDHQRRETFLTQAGIARKIIVKNDAFGGLRAGITQPYGMVIAAGTGVNAAVITPDGEEWAYGYYATYGGAETIVEEAFTAVLRAEDGRDQPTHLTRRALDKFGYATVEQLLRARITGEIDHSNFLTFCPCIFEAALEGDTAATEILTRQARALAEYVTAMVKRFNMGNLAFEVVLAGSIFKGAGTLLVDTISQEILRVAPHVQIVRPHFEPVVGSILLAFDAAHLSISSATLNNLTATMPGTDFFDTRNGTDHYI